MRVRFFGGFEVEVDGAPVAVRGRGQEALLFRLAIDAGTTVGYRALAEDVWPDDPPDDPRAALQSLASRLRRSLPANTLEAAPGGYRLAIARDDVDVTRFQDLAAAAGQQGDDTLQAARLARTALGLWTGEPWTPAGFDWVVRDLLEDRARCERLVRDAAASAEAHATSHLPEIPAALTSLVGRRRELDLIASQLEAERLVTLIGPGGAGKTTLAMESARRHLHAVAVELAPASPGEVWAAVAGAVARSIRVTDAPSTPAGPRERALEALAGRTSLIVLDNCEHVSREAAEVAADLLGTLSGTRILATSREPLGVPGEAFVALGPLPDADAVELFSHRVRAARGTPPADGESDAVDRIVRRLDGLPLALELAAAKTRTLSIAEIDAGLDDRFTLLATGPRAADPRHQTLRALIDWSWETLTGSERTALLTLAVFPDGIDAVDAPLIAREFETDAASFDQLVDRSLLHRTDGRFRMLETVREYGLDRLQADGEEARFRAREARAMAALAIARDPLLRGPEVRRALQWFDVNDENLTSALRTCETDPELIGTGVLLVRARLWEGLMRERFDELMGGLTRFTDLDGPLDSEAAVVATGVRVFVDVFGAIAGAARDDADALSPDRFGERADRISRAAQRHPSELALALPPVLKGARAAMDAWAAGTPWWSVSLVIGDEGLADAPVWTRAFISVMRSALAQNGGDVETLGRESERALAMFRELGDVWGVAMASQMRSEWLMIQGRLDEALAVADASTAGLTGLTSVWDVIQQRSLGISVLMRLGRLDEARERLRDIRALAESEGSERAIFQAELTAAALDVAAGDGAAALARLDAVGDIRLPGPPDQILAWASTKRAQALLLLGRPDEARDALRAALATAGRSGDQPIQADVVVALAMWLADVGRPDDARRALAASVRIRGAVDDSEPMFAALLARLEAPGFELEAPARPEQSANLDELAALLD